MTGIISTLSGTIVTTMIDGAELRFFVANPDDAIQCHHLAGRFFEPEELAIMARHVRPDAVVADIGANIGNHALFTETFLRPRQVILFEASPEAIALLRINLRINGCTRCDERFLGMALSDREGRMEVANEPVNNLGGLQFRPSDAGPFRALRGDTVLAARPVDFIKIDVEGHEMAVLDGLGETIARWRPTIFVELGDYHAEAFAAWREANSYAIAERYERYAGLPNYLIVPK